MSTPVDVRAVLDNIACGAPAGHDFRMARAAVAELIEASPALYDYLEGYLYWQREQGGDAVGLDIAATDIARFRAALARVGGTPNNG